jgi:hypothetical protein
MTNFVGALKFNGPNGVPAPSAFLSSAPAGNAFFCPFMNHVAFDVAAS